MLEEISSHGMGSHPPPRTNCFTFSLALAFALSLARSLARDLSSSLSKLVLIFALSRAYTQLGFRVLFPITFYGSMLMY